MTRLIISFMTAFLLMACTSTSAPMYNPKEFETSNYQKNVDNAVDAADLLSDFDQSKIPQANIDPADISNLVQADLYYNQGEYAHAFPFYNMLSFKYKDPRIIYKAIICLEHVSVTPEQTKSLNDLISLFIQIDPDSKLSKLFKIKTAINDKNVESAEQNLDILMKNDSNNGRAVLLFVSSIISNDINKDSYPILNDFADYVVDHYGAYPEAHLVAVLSYSVSNNETQLSEQVTYINKYYPNWSIPLYWSLDILVRHKHSDTLIKILDPMMTAPYPDRILQNVYIASLMNSSQTEKARAYLTTRLSNEPGNSNILINLAILSIKTNQYTDALNYLNQVQSPDAQVTQVVALVKGSIYDYQNQTSLAIGQYQKVNIQPLVSVSEVMLLSAYISQNNYTAANLILDNLAKEGKMNEEQTIIFKSGYYLGEEKYQVGYDLLKTKLSVYGKNSDYIYQYAALSGMLHKTNQSIALYKKYIKLNSKNPYGYNDLAYIYTEQTNQYSTALKYALQAYKIAPTDPNVQDTLGWTYYKMGDYNKALTYIKSSYDINYDPESARHLSAVYTALNRNDLAKQVIIITKAQMQKELKTQLIQKSGILLNYIQFGAAAKQ